jgi:hypothetical protein
MGQPADREEWCFPLSIFFGKPVVLDQEQSVIYLLRDLRFCVQEESLAVQ